MGLGPSLGFGPGLWLGWFAFWCRKQVIDWLRQLGEVWDISAIVPQKPHGLADIANGGWWLVLQMQDGFCVSWVWPVSLR